MGGTPSKAPFPQASPKREDLTRSEVSPPEVLDRTLIWDQHHLLRALREFEAFYNRYRPHQGIANARPLRPLPPPMTAPDQIACLDIRRRQRLGGVLNEYDHAA